MRLKKKVFNVSLNPWTIQIAPCAYHAISTFLFVFPDLQILRLGLRIFVRHARLIFLFTSIKLNPKAFKRSPWKEKKQRSG